MNDRPDDPESGAGEAKPPKIKAEDNPWYLLGDALRRRANTMKNRRAWNRYFAARLDRETRTKIIKEDGHPKDELTHPFLPEDRQEIEKAFAERCEDPAEASQKRWAHQFQDIQFDEGVRFEKFLFTSCLFGGRFSPARASTKPHSPDRSTSRERLSTVRSISMAQASAKLSLWDRKRIFWYEVPFCGLLSTKRLSPEKSTSNGTIFSDIDQIQGGDFLDGKTHFADATFSGQTYFKSMVRLLLGRICWPASFHPTVDFDGATFYRRNELYVNAIFARTSTFVNAKMKDETSFEGATFEWEPPEFFEAELHQGTVWHVNMADAPATRISRALHRRLCLPQARNGRAEKA